MSQVLSAILGRADVPTHENLQEAISGLKFKLSLDDAYAPFKNARYLPCTLNGEDGGLSLKFEELTPYLEQFPELKPIAGSKDTLITLRSGGDPREDVCVLMVASALADRFDALVHEPKKQTLISAEKLIARAKAQFAELD